MGLQITSELLVKVSNKDEYNRVSKLFAKFNASQLYCDVKSLVLNDIYIDLSEEEFRVFRTEILEEVPNCLLLACTSRFYSSSDSFSYDVFVSYPNRPYEDGHSDYGHELSFGAGDSTLRGCLRFIEKAGFTPEEDELESVYNIFGKSIKNQTIALVSDKEIEGFFQSLTVEEPVIYGSINEKTREVFRWCIITNNYDTMELIKSRIGNSSIVS